MTWPGLNLPNPEAMTREELGQALNDLWDWEVQAKAALWALGKAP